MKRIVSLLAAVLLIFIGAVPALAKEETKDYTIEELKIKFSVSDDMYVFEKENFNYNNTDLAKAGITDVNAFAEKFSKDGALMVIISEDAEMEIDFYKKESSDTREYFDLDTMKEEDYGAFLKEMQPSEEWQKEYAILQKVEDYGHNERRWFKTRIEMEATEEYDQTISELVFATIVNGYAINVDAFVLNGELTPEREEAVKAIVDSIHVYEQVTKEAAQAEASTLTFQDYFTVYGMLVLIAGVVIFFIWNRSATKRRNRDRQVLADRLLEYHRQEKEKRDAALAAGESVQEPEALFRCHTDYDEDAVKHFVSYHMKHRCYGMLIGYSMAALAIILFAVFSNIDIVIRILLVLIALLVFFWEIRLPKKLQKDQEAVFKKTIHKFNDYAFRMKDFRVLGMQASSVYPYFQIIHVGEDSEYFFLYFGDGSAYYVSKEKLLPKDEDAFRKFINERIKRS